MRTFRILLPALLLLGACFNVDTREAIQGGNNTSGNSGGNTGGNTGYHSGSNNGVARCVPGPLADMPEPTGCLRTFFVSTAGNDSSPGSESQPFRTLQKAADTVIAGDCVRVRAGSYDGFTMGWDVQTSGTAAHPIVFQADFGVTINHRAARTADGIDLEPGVDYVRILNFNIVNDGSITRAGIRTVSKYTQIVHNRSHGNGTWGVLTSFTDGLLAECNITSNNEEQHGIYVSNTSENVVVRNNVSFGNGACGLHFNGDLSMEEVSGQTPRGTILNALVEGNLLYDNGEPYGGSAINMDGVQNSIIRNNVLYNNHASGISLYQIDAGDGAKNNQVIGNTIVMPNDGRWAINIADGSTGNVVMNNILYNAHATRGSITIDAASLTGFVSDYNLMVDRMSSDGDNSTIPFATWRSATGQDAHSQLIAQVNDLFVSFAFDDFRLKATSPAVNAGSSQPLHAYDFIGVARPRGGAFDIGAYESY